MEDPVIEAEFEDAERGAETALAPLAKSAAMAAIEQLLVVDPEEPAEAFATFIQRLQNVKRWLRELAAIGERAAVEYVKANGPQEVGDVRYYVGLEKKIKCVDLPAAVDALMIACDGDINAVSACLSSDPIKHGAARNRLTPEEYDRLFQTRTVERLRDGKPAAPKLQSASKRFLPKP